MEQRQLRIMIILAVVVAALAVGALLLESGGEDGGYADEATADIWDVDADAARRVHIQRPDGDVLLEEEDGAWRLVEPLDAPADGRRVGTFLGSLGRTERGIPIPEGELADFGLDDPSFTVSLTTDEGAEAVLTVGDAAIGPRFYALTDDGGVAVVESRLREDLVGNDASWFRDRRLLDFSRSQVASVRIEGPEGTLDLRTGDDGQWWLSGFTRADYDAVQELLMALLSLRVDTYAEAVPGAVELARFHVEVRMEDGVVHTLAVGDETPQGLLAIRGDGTAGWLLPEPAAFLGQGPSDVGDPRAFPVDDVMVEQVDVELGERSATLQRDGDAWQRDGEDATSLREALRLARIHYRAEPVPPLDENYGRLTLHIAGREPVVVEVGQVLDEWRVARDSRGGEPYLVPLADLETITDLL